MVTKYRQRLQAKAAGLLISLETRLDRIMQTWLLLAGLACAARIAFSPAHGSIEPITIAPFLLLILAPFASMVLALRWFADGDTLAQPSTRFARMGRWADIGLEAARNHKLYGAGGVMVSLLVGILLNIPVRALEYLAAMPALSGPIPGWLATLQALMTIDVVLFTSLYAIAFVAALRRTPMFPRLLFGIWLADLTMQILISRVVASAPDLPGEVGSALDGLLQGNITKILISACIWLPYLVLSRRVNVTFRHRVAR